MKRICMVLILNVIFFSGCVTSSVYVDISHERYKPTFQIAKYSAYNNKEIFLSSFSNNADNTSVFYYFSPDSKIKYGEYAITSYYWYCFEKVFNKIGMIIYKDTAPSDIPEFSFEFNYLNDQKIHYSVTVKKKLEIVYHREFDITMPVPESVNIPYLESRAYKMVDSIIINILNDQDFANVLLK